MSKNMWIIILLVTSGQVWTRQLLQEQITQILDRRCYYPPIRINLPSPFFDAEIRHGDVSTLSNYPFIVSLQIYYESLGIFQHFCGGVLLKPNIVLTAAHCAQMVLDGPRQRGSKIQSNFLKNVFATLNPYCRHQAGKQGRISVLDYIIHENYYIGPELGNDIAVIRLQSSFDYDGPYPTLQKSNVLEEGTKAMAAGWGWTDELEARNMTLFLSNATYMRQAQLDYVSDQECRKEIVQHFGFDFYSDSMLCFKSPEKDTCKGDSGGPLVIYDFDYVKGQYIWRLLGLTSFGIVKLCDMGGKVGVYVRISKFNDWITQNVEMLLNASSPTPFPSLDSFIFNPTPTSNLQVARSIDIGVARCVIQPQNSTAILEQALEEFECENGTLAYYFSPERQCEEYTTCSPPIFSTLQDCQTTCIQ